MIEEKIKNGQEELENEKDISNTEQVKKFPGKWYVINCYSGHEERVRDDLIQRVESLNLKHLIFDIRVVKEVVPAKKGKKPTEKNLYAGYIFINMIMDDEAWYIVRNTTGVTGFVGSSGGGTKPMPITQEDQKNMLARSEVKLASAQQGKKVKKIFVASFEVNNYVKILSGSFKDMDGQVTKLDNSKGLATVNLELFGRLTPAEVEFDQCEKIG